MEEIIKKQILVFIIYILLIKTSKKNIILKNIILKIFKKIKLDFNKFI